MTGRALCLALAIGATAAGCGEEFDRDDYVEKNVALLNTVPPFPGARLVDVESNGYVKNEQDDATVGYGTIRTSSLPRGTRAAEVITFYRRTLP